VRFFGLPSECRKLFGLPCREKNDALVARPLLHAVARKRRVTLSRHQRRRSAIISALLIELAACSSGCGAAADKTADDKTDIVAASPETQQRLGVVQWSTKDAPGTIDGLDADDQVVVELKHYVNDDPAQTMHTFTLQERNHGALRQFTIVKNATGPEAFAMLRDQLSKDFVPAEVLDRMVADLGGPSPDTSVATKTVTSGVLRPAGLSADICDPGAPDCLVMECAGKLVKTTVSQANACFGSSPGVVPPRCDGDLQICSLNRPIGPQPTVPPQFPQWPVPKTGQIGGP
jgi:hypothetical protein